MLVPADALRAGKEIVAKGAGLHRRYPGINVLVSILRGGLPLEAPQQVPAGTLFLLHAAARLEEGNLLLASYLLSIIAVVLYFLIDGRRLPEAREALLTKWVATAMEGVEKVEIRF